MLNQVILKGKIIEIFEDRFEMEISDTNDVVTIYGVNEDVILMLLLNNVVSIKGHISTYQKVPFIVLDNLIILDRRGKKNER